MSGFRSVAASLSLPSLSPSPVEARSRAVLAQVAMAASMRARPAAAPSDPPERLRESEAAPSEAVPEGRMREAPETAEPAETVAGRPASEVLTALSGRTRRLLAEPPARPVAPEMVARATAAPEMLALATAALANAGTGNGGTGPIVSPPTCHPFGGLCQTGADCCSKLCDATTNICASSVGACAAARRHVRGLHGLLHPELRRRNVRRRRLYL